MMFDPFIKERKKTYSLEDLSDIANPVLSNASDNASVLQKYKKFLPPAIHFLPKNEQQAFILYYIEKQNYYEISNLLGVSPSTVQRRVTRAKKTLRKLAQICQKSGFFSS